MDSVTQKALHDGLMVDKPMDAIHDTAQCQFCDTQNDDVDHFQGGEMTKEYSQEELDAAIAAAVQPLQSALEDLKTSQQETEIDARITSVKAELEAKISELQTDLDSAVLRAAEAEKVHEEYVAALDALKADEEQKAEIAKRKDERLTTIREVASFPEDYLTSNADRWASLDDEEFEALVNDWKAISTAKKETVDGGLPKQTAMVASRTEGGKSVLSEVLEWNLRGIDPKTL